MKINPEIKIRSKTYYENNKEKLKEYIEKYRHQNVENITKYRAQRISCICGSTISINDKEKHEKTKKHLNYTYELKEEAETI